jgi:hypothetical protein
VRAALALASVLVVATALASPEAPVGGLTELPAPAPDGPNLVDNAGFERPAAAGRLEGWSAALDGRLWALDPDGAHGGRTALRLAGAEGEARIPSAEQRLTLEPGLYTLAGWVRAAGLGANDRAAGARLCLDARPRRPWWHCTDLARGTTGWTRVARSGIVVGERGDYRVTLGAYRRPDGTVWFDDVSLTAAGRRPLDAYLLYPNFRGMLFDDRSQLIRVAVRVEAPAPGARVRLSLVPEAGGATVAERTLPAAPGDAVLELDATPARHGPHRLRVALLDGAGAAAARHPDHRLVKVPGSARARYTAWYDEHNTTYLGGRPRFVLGLYTTSGYATSRAVYARGPDGWGTERMAEAPIDLVINYWLGATPVLPLTTYLDELHARGMYYLQTVNFYHQGHPQYASLPYPAARQGEDALNRWVASTLGKHPGLAGFYTADERPAEMVPTVFRQRRQLAEGAPGTLTYGVLGDGWEEQAPLWRDALDVIGLDPYPIAKRPGDNDLAMVGRWTRLGQDAVHRSRPVWMVIQYFPLTAAGGWPSREDLETMSWMAIVEGARGLFYWSYGARGLAWVKDPRERAQRWRDLVEVTQKIKALEPVLLAPDAAVVREESSGGAVRTLGKRLPDGTRYLFAYNTRGTPVEVAWTLAAPAREVADLDGRPAPRLDGARLGTRLEPFAVRRYRLH